MGQEVDLSDLKRLHVEDDVFHVRGIVAVNCVSACASAAVDLF